MRRLASLRVWVEFLCWYLFWGVVGCASGAHTYTVGPFVPNPLIYCGADQTVCPEGYECAFPGVDTVAVCMPSKSE